MIPALGQSPRTFPERTSAFGALTDLARAPRFGVVIDEYPSLADAVPGLSTLLQRVWDTTLHCLFRCLTGSASPRPT
jgi:hypothetical protein